MYQGSNRRFSGRFWAFFWVFSVYHGFFWVFSGLIGIFSPPIQWPGFQIGGVGGGSGGRCWLQLVCVWPLLIAVCGSIDGLVVCVYVCGFVDGSSLFVCVDPCVW